MLAALRRPGRRSFAFDVVLTVGGKATFALLGVLITVLIARELGPSGQGVFAVMFNLTLMLMQLGGAGLSVANAYVAAREPEAQPAIVRASLTITATTSTALAVGVVCLFALAPGVFEGVSWTELGITLAALPAAVSVPGVQAVLLGRRQMVVYSAVEVLQIGAAFVVLAVLFAVADPSVAAVLAVIGASRYLALAVALVAAGVRGGARIPLGALRRRLLSHAGRVYVVGLFVFLLIRIDVLIVNAVVGTDDAGRYSVAALIAEGLGLLPLVIGTNLLPRIAADDRSDLAGAVFRTVALGYGAICLLALPVSLVAIPLVFGEAYEGAAELFAWLLPGAFCVGLLNALVTHYYVRGYPTWLIGVWGAALATNIAANLLILPSAGVIAAPIISSATYAAVLVAHMIAFAHDEGGYDALVPRPREVAAMVRGALRRG